MWVWFALINAAVPTPAAPTEDRKAGGGCWVGGESGEGDRRC